MNTIIKEHIERCIELYGQPLGVQNDAIISKTVDRVDYEQMRCDLMIAVGMLAAINGARHD